MALLETEYIEALSSLNRIEVTDDDIKEYINKKITWDKSNKDKITIFQNHDIFNMRLFMIGSYIAKYKGPLSGELEQALYDNYLQYEGKDAFLNLCYIIYELTPFHIFVDKFGLSDFSFLKGRLYDMIKELRTKYDETKDKKYLYIINLILRKKSYSCIKFYEKIEQHYKPCDDKKILNMNFAKYSYGKHNSELYKAVNIKSLIEEAYTLIAQGTKKSSDMYRRLFNECEPYVLSREVDIHKVYKTLVSDGLNNIEISIMKTIMLADIKYHIKTGYLTDGDNIIYIHKPI